MNERWRVIPQHVQGGPTRWRVHDEQDAGRPVAEFDDEVSAQAHADRLAAGPLDWDEQEAWKDPDDWDAPRARGDDRDVPPAPGDGPPA